MGDHKVCAVADRRLDWAHRLSPDTKLVEIRSRCSFSRARIVARNKYDEALKDAPNWKELKEAREVAAKQKS